MKTTLSDFRNLCSLVQTVFGSLLLLLLAGCFLRENSSEKIVVKVNDHSLHVEQLAKSLVIKLRTYDALAAKQTDLIQNIKNQLVQEFIVNTFITDYARKNKISPDAQTIESEVAKVRAGYPDDVSFRSALAQEGQSFDDWKLSFVKSLTERLVFSHLTKAVRDPGLEEIQEYYKKHNKDFEIPAKVRLRQVVMEKEEDAKRILAKLRQGGDLEKLAKDFSVAPEGAVGGDTGWISKGSLEVFDLAFNLPIGARSQIIKSGYGFHIFEVMGKRSAGLKTLEQAKADIVANLRSLVEKRVFDEWLAEEIKSAKIYKNKTLIEALSVHTEH